MSAYDRPIVQCDSACPADAVPLAGGWGWFSHVERLERGRAPVVIPAHDAQNTWIETLSTPRTAIAGLTWDAPVIMGILNVTPDSFSDGGQFADHATAVRHAADMVAAGAHIIDIGGESTRPGAETVASEAEKERTAPVISALRASGMTTPISIDTRKSTVAKAALDAGATLVNDVSGFTFDPDLAPLCAARDVPVCVMHAQGDPESMQKNPTYDDVVLDVFDFLQGRINALVAAGIPRGRIIADPGIGFGKTLEHNLKILQRISLFHGLGVPILLGASRKRFIGTLSETTEANDRMPGSVAVALAALYQGVQIVRVHDVGETRQAVALWQACKNGE